MPAKRKAKAPASAKSGAPSAKSAKAPPPAYFLSLSVENVRCFGPKQTLDLSDGNGRPARWTIILGDNGTGKTTLLQSLVEMEPVRLGSDMETSMVVPKGMHPLRTEGPHGPSLLFLWDLYSREAETNLTISTRISGGRAFTKRATKTEVENFDLAITSSGSRASMSSGDDWLLGLVCYAYGAARRMGTSALTKDQSDDPTASLFLEAASLRNAEEWLLQADYTVSKSSAIQEKAEKRLEIIKDVLINVLPDVDKIRFPQLKQVKDKPRVEFRTPYGWVPIRKLGFGYQTLIAWTVDLASRFFDRYPKSRNAISEPAVVLVDEIDLHMHPLWQRKIMSFLSERFQNTQFIVTAHSPLIVQAATDANIAVLRREGDHVVIDQSIKAVRGWRIDQVLTSDLFGLETARPPEFDELLQERKKILTKARLTKRDKEKLGALNAQMGELPTGENLADLEARDIIQRAAERIKKSGH